MPQQDNLLKLEKSGVEFFSLYGKYVKDTKSQAAGNQLIAFAVKVMESQKLEGFSQKMAQVYNGNRLKDIENINNTPDNFIPAIPLDFSKPYHEYKADGTCLTCDHDETDFDSIHDPLDLLRIADTPIDVHAILLKLTENESEKLLHLKSWYKFFIKEDPNEDMKEITIIKKLLVYMKKERAANEKTIVNLNAVKVALKDYVSYYDKIKLKANSL